MKIESIIDEVWDGKYVKRDWEANTSLMVHRCGVDLLYDHVFGYDAISVANTFLGKNPKYPEVAKVTGGQNPYTFYIGGDLGPEEFDGRIWQALPLDEVGYHARRFSSPMIGVGLIFDGRKKKPSDKQYNSLVDLLHLICRAYAWEPYKKILGHGEVDGAHGGTKTPEGPDACPGHPQFINMNIVRDDVATMTKHIARAELYEAGLVFEGKQS